MNILQNLHSASEDCYWTKNRMPDKWRDLNKHQVTGTFKSSEDWLVDIRNDILAVTHDLLVEPGETFLFMTRPLS